MRLTASGLHKDRQALFEIVDDPASGGYFLLITYTGAEMASDFWYLQVEDALTYAEEDFGVARDQWVSVPSSHEMTLSIAPYLEQARTWAKAGRHVMAQFDDESVVVYQAYDPHIANFALREGHFGGDFSFSRMSWIKPGFLWMMYRSGWGTKEGQRVVLAIRLRRNAFETILSQAVPSTYDPVLYSSRLDHQAAIATSSVRLQWDPDHDPQGNRLERRAIQLGLRDEVLARYAKDWILEIQDLSEFVGKQRQYAMAGAYDRLVTPRESVYPICDPQLVKRLGLDRDCCGRKE